MEPVQPLIDTQHSELSDREMQRAINFLRAVWKLGACRVCGNHRYELAAIVVQHVVGGVDVLADARARRRPTASLTCSSCGEVRFLDLSVAKIVAPSAGNPQHRG